MTATTEMNDTGPIKVEFVRTRFLTRYGCHVCGGHTDKSLMLCEVTQGPYTGFRVCETCLREGNIFERLEEHARALEQHAASLREAAGRLVVPTYDEWRRAELRALRDDYLDEPGGAETYARERLERIRDWPPGTIDIRDHYEAELALLVEDGLITAERVAELRAEVAAWKEGFEQAIEQGAYF